MFTKTEHHNFINCKQLNDGFRFINIDLHNVFASNSNMRRLHTNFKLVFGDFILFDDKNILFDE